MEENTENKLDLDLGQIIKIIAPINDALHEKIFFIDYLDDKNITLINQKENKIIELNVSGNIITDESIESIEILYNPEEKGYARQNNLIVGASISIEFGGNSVLPTIINGEITNLENDMIELEVFPSKQKIYIDFKYQGIPKELNIISIRPFEKPLSEEELKEEKDEEKESKKEDSLFDEEVVFEEDELDDLELNYDEAENVEKNDIMIIDANDIIFSKETLLQVTEMVNINEENKRYSIEQQVTDLLDNLLSTVSAKNRTKNVINEINKTITRFKQLRIEFSNFKEDGMINTPKLNYKEKEHKSLLNKLLNLENDFKWLIPVVQNKKKLYDIKIFGEEKINDYIVDTTDNFIETFNETLDLYINDDINSSNDKYKFTRERLNNIQKNFVDPKIKRDIISKIKISTDIHTIVDNQYPFLSSVYFNENAKLKKNYFQKYITGESTLHKNDNSNFYTEKKLIENENLFLKGFIVMPEKFKEYSKLYLYEKNLYEKILLTGDNINYNILEDMELENIEITEDFENSFLPIDEKEPYQINFIETRNYEDRNDTNIYNNFLKSIIPSNEEIIKKSHNLYKNKTTNIGFIKELEHYMIYPKDINLSQYEIINQIIDKNMTRMKKSLAKRENNYMNKAKPLFEYKNLFLELFGNSIGLKSNIEDMAELYNIKNINANECMRNIISHDSGNCLNILLSLSQQTLYQKDNFNLIMEQQIGQLKNEEEEEMKKELCKEFILTKKYEDIEQLKNDNGKQEIYYDREYDTTRYEIMQDFEADRNILEDDALLKKIKEHLIKNVGIEEKQASLDAYSMIIGRKPIKDGTYAVLDLGDYEFRYYERKNNNWRLNDELSDKIPDDAIFCNMKEKCLKIKDKCGSIEKNNIENQKELLNDIAKNFSENLNIEHKKQLKRLTRLKEESFLNLKNNIEFENKKLIERDLLMVKLGNSVEDSNIITSPHAKLRDAILGQTNIVKKYADIILFIKKYCREYEPTTNENENWFYCIESNVPLLPSFFLELSESFENENYSNTINDIIKVRGVLSDDGDKMVDKHSGYLIKIIHYDTVEGYDKDGYKINTKEVMEEDEEDVIKNVLQQGVVEKKSKTSKIIKQLIDSIAKNIGINISEYTDNMIKIIIQLNNENTKGKQEYNVILEKANKRKKTIKSYSTHVYEILFLSLISVFIITVQTAIPEIKTSKTFPGCVKSFNGYPLNNLTSKKDFLNYVICVLIKIKSDKKIWSGLPNIKKVTTKTLDKFDKYVHKVKTFIGEKALNNIELMSKLKMKKEWLNERKKTLTITEEYKLKKWNTFLPPIDEIKIGSVQMLGSNFTGLLDNIIKKGKNGQFKLMNSLIGKIRELSFAIIEKINKVVEKKELLFMTNTGTPYLQNACCNDKNNNVYDYFVDEDKSINKYNENIALLEKIKIRDMMISKSPYFYSDIDTKIKRRKIENNITEETIYRAFIKHCKFNSGINLPEELKKICGANVSSFNKYDSITDKIFKMKQDDGLIFDKDLFNILIKTLHKKKILNLEIEKNIKIKKTSFEELIKYLLLKESKTICDKEILSKIIELMDRFSINYNDKTDDIFEDFILLINAKIEESIEKIKEFLQGNIKKGLTKSIKFIEKIEKYNTFGDDNYMSEEDNSDYRIGQQLKNMIFDICKVFPEIVSNKVNYEDKPIPTHWKLSMKHTLLLKNIIADEMKDLKSVYGNELNVLLKNIIDKSVNLLNMVELIPFYSNIDEKNKSILNGKFYKILNKYFFFCAINMYVDIFDDLPDQNFLRNEEVFEENKAKSVDEALLKGRKSTLKQTVAEMISKMLIIFSKRKKILNITKSKIKKSVMKSRVKEKFGITENLRKLSDEERKVEDTLKNHKLGKWNLGQTKALFEYDPNQYDKERDALEKTAILEIQMGKIDDVTLENMEIFMMENLEEKYREDRLLQEELALDMRDEGDRDGEENW